MFKRLFQQRHANDRDLLQAAEACALVYSFDSETSDGEEAEWPLLATLVEQSPQTLHRHIAELQRRKLMQKRGKWRAIMPQALALHLARQGLENIPVSILRAIMDQQAPIRLRRSFARRLGHLHDNETAQQIVTGWLQPGGMLGDIGAFAGSSDSWAMVESIAPVCPAQTLDAIQRAMDHYGDEVFFGHEFRREFSRLCCMRWPTMLRTSIRQRA